jgi:hypothetical protein
MQKRLWVVSLALILVAAIGFASVNTMLADAFSKGPTQGPFTADGICPVFKESYKNCEVLFGNRGFSTLSSFYETFMGEGAFEIYSFGVESLPGGRFNITAQSNRGPIRSEIYTDRLVRLGQDREDEAVYRTQQSAYCDAGRIYEHQVGYVDAGLNVQDLEFWTEGNVFRFRLFQNGSPTADVKCKP